MHFSRLLYMLEEKVAVTFFFPLLIQNMHHAEMVSKEMFGVGGSPWRWRSHILQVRSGAWSWLQSCFTGEDIAIFPCLFFDRGSGHKTSSVYANAVLFQLCVVNSWIFVVWWTPNFELLNYMTMLCSRTFFFSLSFHCTLSVLFYLYSNKTVVLQVMTHASCSYNLIILRSK